MGATRLPAGSQGRAPCPIMELSTSKMGIELCKHERIGEKSHKHEHVGDGSYKHEHVGWEARVCS